MTFKLQKAYSGKAANKLDFFLTHRHIVHIATSRLCELCAYVLKNWLRLVALSFCGLEK